jgi:hypothetical protein
MPFYSLHNPYGLTAPLTLPIDYATNTNYAWLAFTTAERCALNVASLPTHRVCVDARYVPSHVLAQYSNPASHVGYVHEGGA